jgi:hypothetical protein
VQLPAERGDLAIQGLVAAGEGAKRQHRSHGRRGRRTRLERRSGRDQLSSGQVAELLAEGVGGGDQQGLERVDGLGAGPHGRLAGNPEHPQHLHHAIGGLGQPGRLAGLHRTGGGLGVDRIGLAMAAAGGPVGPVDLHDPLPVRVQEAGQLGAVATGALDTERLDLAQRASPAQQLGVAGAGGGH